jgi:hypothetical protein
VALFVVGDGGTAIILRYIAVIATSQVLVAQYEQRC